MTKNSIGLGKLPHRLEWAVYVTPVGRQVAEATYFVTCWSADQACSIVRSEHNIGPDFLVEAVLKSVNDAIDAAMQERGKIIDE